MYPPDFSKLFRRRLAEGRLFNDALRDLRVAGASIIESIAAVKRVRGCDLVEAKRLVHHSKAWADVTKPTEAMWARLAEELESDPEPDTPPESGSATSEGNSEAQRGS